jgi:hypothetical protein
MPSLLDFVSHNIGYKRRSKRQAPRVDPTMAPTLDVPTGIIAVRYPEAADSDKASSNSSTRKASSDYSSSTPSTPISEPGDSSGMLVAAAVPSPLIPRRHASHRVARSVDHVVQRRAAAATSSDLGAVSPPPIPAKSPYRASRAMVRLQQQLVEDLEEEMVEEVDEIEFDRQSHRTI